MKLSEFIEKLQAILAEHGDMPVVSYDSESGDNYDAHEPEFVRNIKVVRGDPKFFPVWVDKQYEESIVVEI